MTWHTCPVCQVQFLAYPQKIFCSDKHKQRAYRERQKKEVKLESIKA